MENEKKKAFEVPGQEPGSGEQASASATPINSKWRERLKSRNPELDMENDDAMDEYLGGQFDKVDKADADNKRLNELITSDDRYANTLSGIFSGQEEDGTEFNLVKHLFKNYWPDLKDYENSEEALAALDERLKEEEETKSNTEKAKEEIASNFEQMKQDANDAMQQTGVDEKTMQELVNWLYGVTDPETGEITEEGLCVRIEKRCVNTDDFVKLIHAYTREGELEKARQSGMSEGRKQRPGASHRNNSSIPTYTGGGGSSESGEGEEEKNPIASRYGSMKPRYT